MHSALPEPLEIYLLGLVDFEDAQSLQRRLVYEYGERPGGALILCEHPPTISVGRAGSRMHIVADDDELRDWGIPVRWVNRGGGCLLHMPGQITGYLILPLGTLGLDVNRYLTNLQKVLLGVLDEFDLGRTARFDVAGLTLGAERVASVGIAVRRWIAYYGFTLNVGPFLAPFQIIEERLPDGRIVHQTSMESVRQRPAPMAKVRESLIRQVEQVFGLERHVLFTSHPSIRRPAPTHALVQSHF
jgi:lipoyl(octanoyl) transferase